MYQRNNRRPYLVSLVGGLALVAISVNQHARPQTVAQGTTDQLPAPRGPAPASINSANQASPQGPTGPIETKSGGAPAASPQGDTPAGMQAVPQDPDKAIRPPKSPD